MKRKKILKMGKNTFLPSRYKIETVQKLYRMEQLFKKIFLITVCLLLLTHCQFEELKKTNTLDTNQIVINKITKKDISPEVINKLESLINMNIKSKTIYDSINNFSIDTDYAKYLTKGNYHSYTFKITRFKKNNLLENLVISLKPDGTYKTTIVSYNLTPEEKEKIENSEYVDIVNKTSIKVIDNIKRSSTSNRQILIASDGSCWDAVYGSSQATGWEAVVGYTEIICPWGGSDSGGSGPSDWGTSVEWGTSGDGDTATNSTGIEVITSPISGSGGTSSQNNAQKFFNSFSTISFERELLSAMSIEASGLLSNYLNNNPYPSTNTTAAKTFITSLTQNRDWFTAQSVVTQTGIFNYLIPNNFYSENRSFVNQLINQMLQNPDLNLDINSSFKSPMNIDNIAIDSNTTEGAKFNSVYKALTDSPEFKKLFVNIFNNNTRFNVKFEIAEHVYEDNNPAKKEVNATTSQDPVTKNIIIKISKQILIADNPKSQTKIENAKTILHECIHAYLFVKANNPTVGVDFVKILNTMYPNAKEQHDFMYNQMIPTMQKVLSEIRDSVTTTAGRAEVEQRTMHPTFMPLTSTPWFWTEYYKYISINGLEEANCFKEDFPKNSDQWNLLAKYIEYGHDDLRP